MTKLEELMAAANAAEAVEADAWDDANAADVAEADAWDTYWAARDANNAARDAYEAELKKTQEENSHD
jgi:hypothetical protein